MIVFIRKYPAVCHLRKQMQKQLAKPILGNILNQHLKFFGPTLKVQNKTVLILIGCEKKLLQEGIIITMKAFSCIRCQHRCHWHSLAIAIFSQKHFLTDDNDDVGVGTLNLRHFHHPFSSRETEHSFKNEF